MNDVIQNLAGQTGLSGDLVQKGLGALLAFLKSHLGGDVVAKLSGALPNAEQLVRNHEASPAAPETGGGLGAALGEWAGKIFGGGAASDLIKTVSKAGLSPDQIQAFLPKALAWLQSALPPDLFAKIKGLVPGLAGAAEAPQPAG